jgi:pyrroline-5-carboxylate reductase
LRGNRHDCVVVCICAEIAAWLERQGVRQAEAREYTGRLFSELAAAALEAPRLSFESLAAGYATRGGINEQVLIHLTERGVFDTVAGLGRCNAQDCGGIAEG